MLTVALALPRNRVMPLEHALHSAEQAFDSICADYYSIGAQSRKLTSAVHNRLVHKPRIAIEPSVAGMAVSPHRGARMDMVLDHLPEGQRGVILHDDAERLSRFLPASPRAIQFNTRHYNGLVAQGRPSLEAASVSGFASYVRFIYADNPSRSAKLLTSGRVRREL